MNSQPGMVSPFPFRLKPSHSLGKGCTSLILKGHVPHQPWEVLEQDTWFPPLSPQGRVFSELLFFHLHQASILTSEAAGTRRGQTSVLPPDQNPSAGESQISPPHSHTRQLRCLSHKCKKVSIISSGQPALLPCQWPVSKAPQAGTQVRCRMVEAGSSHQSCDQQFEMGRVITSPFIQQLTLEVGLEYAVASTLSSRYLLQVWLP